MAPSRTFLLLAGTAGALLLGCANFAKQKLPLREIERPLVLPAYMRQGSVHAGIRVEGDSLGYDLSLIPLTWRFSVAPNLEFPKFPWQPYVRYEIDRPRIDIDNEVIANPYSLVLAAGMTAWDYSSRAGFSATFAGGVEHRTVLTPVHWFDAAGHVGVTTRGDLDFDATAGLGLQMTRTVSLWIGYTPSSNSLPVHDITGDALAGAIQHAIAANLSWNYAQGFSIALRPTVTSKAADLYWRIDASWSYQR